MALYRYLRRPSNAMDATVTCLKIRGRAASSARVGLNRADTDHPHNQEIPVTAGRSIVVRTAGAVWNVTESDGNELGGTFLLDAGDRTYSVRRTGAAAATQLKSHELLALLAAMEDSV